MTKDKSTLYLKYSLVALILTLIVAVAYYFFFFLPEKEYQANANNCYKYVSEYMDELSEIEIKYYFYSGEAVFSKKNGRCMIVIERIIDFPDSEIWFSYSFEDIFSGKVIASYDEKTSEDCENYSSEACSKEEFDKIVDSYR